jgi:cytochrome c
MKAVSGIIVAAATLLVAGQALAASAPKEAATCMACHDVAEKKIGPTYKDVAKKYAGAADAVDKLTKKVIAGGMGVWGQVPMPPRGASTLKDDEIKKVVMWIMTQK